MRAHRIALLLGVVGLAAPFYGTGSASEASATTVTRTAPYDGAAFCYEDGCNLEDSSPRADLARNGILTTGGTFRITVIPCCWCIGPVCGGQVINVPVPGAPQAYTLVEIVPPTSGQLIVSALVSGHSYQCLALRSPPSEGNLGEDLVAPMCRNPVPAGTLFSTVAVDAGSPVWAWIGVSHFALPTVVHSLSYSIS